MPTSQLDAREQARMMPEPFELVSKRQDTPDTWTLELAARSGRPLDFSPGQFTMLSTGGCGEVPISISGDPDHPDRLVHTVRAAGLATQAICAAERGGTLGVRGPFGRPWPLEQSEGRDLVFAGGGIGLPPLRPAIVAALARRERYGRLVVLYGGRTPEQLLYGDELAAWSERGVDVMVTVDSAGPDWPGNVGVVTRLVPRAGLRAENTVAMCCGPEVMMRFTAAALREAGVCAQRLFASVERNMQCGIARCGHCQLGPTLVCRDGPVYRWAELERWLAIREL